MCFPRSVRLVLQVIYVTSSPNLGAYIKMPNELYTVNVLGDTCWLLYYISKKAGWRGPGPCDEERPEANPIGLVVWSEREDFLSSQPSPSV
jgi:hypothetical protein